MAGGMAVLGGVVAGPALAIMGVVMGAKALYPVYVFVLVEILIYGFGIWGYTYLYIWAILVVIILIVRGCRQITDNPVTMAVIGGIYGLAFGALSVFPTLIIGGWAAGWAYFISGLSFDISHCLGNVVTVLVLYKPLKKLLSYVLTRYGGLVK